MKAVHTAALNEAGAIGGTEGVLWAVHGQLAGLIAHIFRAFTNAIFPFDLHLFPIIVAPWTTYVSWQNHLSQLKKSLKCCVADIDNGID